MQLINDDGLSFKNYQKAQVIGLDRWWSLSRPGAFPRKPAKGILQYQLGDDLSRLWATCESIDWNGTRKSDAAEEKEFNRCKRIERCTKIGTWEAIQLLLERKSTDIQLQNDQIHGTISKWERYVPGESSWYQPTSSWRERIIPQAFIKRWLYDSRCLD